MKGYIWATIPAALILLLAGCMEPVAPEKQQNVGISAPRSSEALRPKPEVEELARSVAEKDIVRTDPRFIQIDTLNRIGWVQVRTFAEYNLVPGIRDLGRNYTVWCLRFPSPIVDDDETMIYLCYKRQGGSVVYLKQVKLQGLNGKVWRTINLPQWPE